MSTNLDTVACFYARREAARPACAKTATVVYGNVALCRSCDMLRSTVGKGMTARLLPQGQLDAVSAAGELVDQAKAHLVEVIQQARDNGCSWANIGDRLGLSRQALQQHYGRSKDGRR